MAVYTEITPTQATELLGVQVQALEPLPGGIENSNYRVDTADGASVLTIIERQDPARLLPPLRWMDQLHDAGLPVPRTLATELEFAGKPVVHSSWCEGEHVEQLSDVQVGAVGALLGAMHREQSAEPLPPDAHDRRWLEERVFVARGVLNGADREAAMAGWWAFEALEVDDLPSGAIHADVFRDNLLFQGDTVSGLVDFHYACTGPFIYELAIAANDLCSRPDGSSVKALEAALLWGYQGARRLTAEEEAAWGTMRALAAFRFWMSRLWDRESPREGPMPLTKDPDEFRRRYLERMHLLDELEDE